MSEELTVPAPTEHDVKPFGSSIQQFSQKMNNALSKFKLSDNLSDENYITWARSMMQLFRSLEFHNFVLTKNFIDSNLNQEENSKIRFNLTVFILNDLDADNNTRICNHLTDPSDPDEIIYDPFECWSELKSHHNRISEDKLEAVTKALYACKIQRGDTLSAFVDKFENLIREFYRLKGELSDAQSARQLLSAIPTLPDNVINNIHDKVDPLTRREVAKYLIKYEERHGWTSPAIREAHGASASHTLSTDKTKSGGCSPTVCVGPHMEKNCWSKPENAEKRKAFLIRQRGGKPESDSRMSASTVRGIKKIDRPTANAASLSDAFSFHLSFDCEDTEDEIYCALPSVFEEEPSPSAANTVSSSSSQILGLHDTGATHCMFKDRQLFDTSTLTPVEDKAKRVKLPGGDMSLAVHSRGVAKLKSGDGTPFTIKNTLYVPSLSQNLISGGLLKRQGV